MAITAQQLFEVLQHMTEEQRRCAPVCCFNNDGVTYNASSIDFTASNDLHLPSEFGIELGEEVE